MLTLEVVGLYYIEIYCKERHNRLYGLRLLSYNCDKSQFLPFILMHLGPVHLSRAAPSERTFYCISWQYKFTHHNIPSFLNKKAKCSLEIFVSIYKAIRCHNPDERNVHLYVVCIWSERVIKLKRINFELHSSLWQLCRQCKNMIMFETAVMFTDRTVLPVL
jgi:hypothetical protein